MDERRHAELLARVAVLALEEGAFIFSEPSPEDPHWDCDEVVEAVLDLGEPPQSRLGLCTTWELANELAANMLGLDSASAAVAEVLARDALAEMLNLIAGAAVAELDGALAAAAIGVPRVEKVAAPVGRATTAGAASLVLLTEHGPCVVTMDAR